MTATDSQPRIASARIERGKSMWDGPPKVYVKFEGFEEEHFLFDFYPDEISFTESEFVGLTEPEARHLKFKKDKAFLQS